MLSSNRDWATSYAQEKLWTGGGVCNVLLHQKSMCGRLRGAWANPRWGSPILFSWRVNGHFCLPWSLNENLFFPWFVNLYFPILGKLVFNLFVTCEMCIYFPVICEPTTFAGIICHFFGDFSIIKARKLHQTRWKTCPFDASAHEKLIGY